MKPIIFAFALMATACSQNVSPPAQHDLGFSNNSADNSNAASITVTAPEWLRDYRIHYRLLYDNPTQVRFYTLDRWLAPLPELFQQRIRAAGAAHPFALEIELLEFEQQFTAPQQAQVVIRFNVLVYDEAHKKMAGKQFALQQPAATADAKGAVTAFATLTQQAIREINAWLLDSGLHQ